MKPKLVILTMKKYKYKTVNYLKNSKKMLCTHKKISVTLRPKKNNKKMLAMALSQQKVEVIIISLLRKLVNSQEP